MSDSFSQICKAENKNYCIACGTKSHSNIEPFEILLDISVVSEAY